MLDLTNFLDWIGLEAIWALDQPRRAMGRLVVTRQQWLQEPQLIAALPPTIVLAFRLGVLKAKGNRLPEPESNKIIQVNRDRPPSQRN